MHTIDCSAVFSMKFQTLSRNSFSCIFALPCTLQYTGHVRHAARCGAWQRFYYNQLTTPPMEVTQLTKYRLILL